MKKFAILSFAAFASLGLAACGEKPAEEAANIVDANATMEETIADINATADNAVDAAGAALDNAADMMDANTAM
jgi:hypothetical protein